MVVLWNFKLVSGMGLPTLKIRDLRNQVIRVEVISFKIASPELKKRKEKGKM
ncbi:hypothetical protein CsSME_00002977 [Camellia sinensis var. sinensis]